MMLTLVLLVGAVSCSPVPSEPSLPTSLARHGTSPAGAAHVEATHDERQVTFEVIEEVGETTLSTTSSDLSGEDDPPIPTATTPPVLPESEPQEANPAVTEPHDTQQQQQQQREANSYISNESLLVIQPQEPHDVHPHASLPHSPPTHHDSHNTSSHASSYQRQTSTTSETIHPNATTTSSEVKQNDTPPEIIHSHGANSETSLSHEKSSEDTLPHKLAEQDSESGNDNTSPQTVSSEEGSTERSPPSSLKMPPSQSSENEHSQSPEKHQPHEASVSGDSDGSSQQKGDDGSNGHSSKNASEASHNVPHHHYHPEVESVVEADLHSWESSEHKHSSASKDGDDTEDAGAGEDLADVGNQGVKNVVSRENNRTLPLRGAVRETILVGHSLELAKDENVDTKDSKVEYIDTGALSTDTEEDTTDEFTAEELQQQSKIQVSIAGESVQHPPEPAGSDAKPSEENDGSAQAHGVSDSQTKEEKSENTEEEPAGEEEVVPSLVLDSSSPIDIVERSEGAEKEVLEADASETVVETVARETDLTPAETTVEEDGRESRIYLKATEDQTADAAASAEDQGEHENHDGSKMNAGLESMSMTSPTPDTSLEEETEATIMPPEILDENDNITAIETEDKVEGSEESPVPVPSVAPPPAEDYTDNYSDPISAESLPDELVTQEEIPSRERPQTDYPLLSTSDKEASGNLRTQGGVAWALPPQQEQVSAVAPDSLTPGCIVAIVFGVIISVCVLLGIAGFVVWQRRTLNRPKVLGSDRGYAGSDSGGYIDDQVRVSYVNSQIDSPKGSPEDLISLDNDSFLNSLESMTIQNLWTDNIRHTKL